MQKPKLPNQLVVYRRRMGLPQRLVSRLLGHQGASVLSRYERGRLLPTLEMALRLEIIYRVPVAFLFPTLYETLRANIRSTESQMAGPGQQTLL